MPPKRLILLITLLGVALGVTINAHQAVQDTRPLDVGKPVERELAGDQAHAYTIALAASQYLRVVVEQRGIDVTVTLSGPDGKTLATVDSPNGMQGPEPVSFVTEVPGIYRMEVRSLQKTAAAGRYEIAIEELRPATATDRGRQAAEQAFAEAEHLYAQRTAASVQAALKKYEEALAQFRAVADRKREAAVLDSIGIVYLALNQSQKALDVYEQSLPLHRASGDRAGEGFALTYMAGAYDQLGDKKKALEYYAQALPLRRAAGDRIGEAATLNNLGRTYDDLGEPQKAIEHYTQSLVLVRAVGNRSAEATLLNNIGSVNESLGEKSTALDYYSQAVAIARALGDRNAEATVLNNIGRCYNDLGEKQKALDHYGLALPLFRAAGNRIGEGATFHNTGAVYSSLGERQKALEFYNQALSVFRALGDRRREATSLNSIGLVYDTLNQKQKALDFYAQALPLIRAVGNRSGEAVTLGNMGGIYKDLGEKQKALEHYAQALDLARAIGDPGSQARTLNNIATVHMDLGETQKAFDHFAQALPLYRAVGNRSGEAGALFNVATLERTSGKLTESLSSIEAALTIVESLRTKIGSQELRSSYFATVQRFYEFQVDLLMQLHQQQPSAGHAGKALQTSEHLRARSLLEMLAEAKADIRQGVDAALLERERSLLAQLNAKARQQSQLLGRTHTEAQASAAVKELDALTTEYQQTQAVIRTTSPRYAALTQPRPLTLQETQGALDPDTLLLEYSLGTDRSYLWAVTPTTVATFELPKRAEVETLARRYYEELTARNQRPAGESATAWQARITAADRALPATAATLSRMILGPAVAVLPGKRLVIAPVGALQYVPFGSLPHPSDAGARSAPISSRHQVVIVPSISAVAVQRQFQRGRANATKTVAVLADPVFDNGDSRVGAAGRPDVRSVPAEAAPAPSDLERAAGEAGVVAGGGPLPRLRFSRDEATAILGLVPKASGLKALDFDATANLVTGARVGDYRILHIASHAFLNGDHPQLTGIALSMVDAQGRAVDGFLRLAGIYNLTLSADLVVLSACQTALGRDAGGEGLVGLTRGFMYSGASRVVGSLWKVDDEATAHLMKLFYQHMLGKDKMRPAAALRAAQEGMRRTPRWQAPYYWAAFVLEGDWR